MPGGSPGGGGMPGGSPGGAGMPGGSPGGSGTPGDTSGGSGMPGGTGGNLPGAGSGMPGGQGDGGAGNLPGGQSGGSGDGLPGGQGGSGGGSGQGTGEEGWEDGLPGGGDGGWQTSNQEPVGGTSPIPPMPSDRGKPPGDGELDGALEDFDGEILSEREVIRKRSNETAGTSGSGGSSLPESSAGNPSGGDGTADMPGGYTGGVPSNRNTPPPPSPAASAGVPDDIPDARDDDIIARQLREAAVAENDPELKEKLWDEYRRYKGI